jgi:HSP20 family molecular chaperone IbpA
MDRAFGDALSRPDLFEVPNLALDKYETTDTDVVVKTALPGVTPRRRGSERARRYPHHSRGTQERTGAEDEKRQYNHRESSYGRFFRAVTLRHWFKAEEAKAEFRERRSDADPAQAEEAKPKTIKVQAH